MTRILVLIPTLVAGVVLVAPDEAVAQEPACTPATAFCVEAITDPGTAPWVPVAEAEVAETCKLDPALLDQVALGEEMSFAVVRYGRLCYVSGEGGSHGPGVSHVFSATKTLGAVLTGMVIYESRVLSDSGAPRTGPLYEWDPMSKWIDLSELGEGGQINPNATVAHVLSMVGYSEDLTDGQKVHQYDATGRREINYLIDVIDNVVAQNPRQFGDDAVDVKDRLFEKLGMEHSSWDVEYFGYTWNTSLLDMARLGLVILRGGIYNGERIMDSRYVYNMTHPAFEDGSTRYGYLTWLDNNPASCAPRAIHSTYPHGLSTATDCADGNCEQEYDVGVWNAAGAGGQYIIGHKGLDLLVVGKNWEEGGATALWEAVLPSVVAGDPMYSGDQQAFCEAYSAGSYAPDIMLWQGGL